MSMEEEIVALKKYEEELTSILGRFKKTRDGIHINSDDDSRFRQIAIEIRDLLDDIFGDNSYSSMIVSHFNEGISNFKGSPSYKSVENIRGIVSSVITKLKRSPNNQIRNEAKTPAEKNIEPEFPEKVTVGWLIRHVPVGIWIASLGIISTVFIAGIQASQISVVQEVFGLKPQSVSPAGENYKELVSDIYSYKKVNGPPPNVGVIVVAIRGLRNFESKKEESLLILRSLKSDSYLTNQAFATEYKQIMNEAKATIMYLETK